jgi:integrase
MHESQSREHNYYAGERVTSAKPEEDRRRFTIAQMLGHSSTQIVQRYAQVLDQNRHLMQWRNLRTKGAAATESANNEHSGILSSRRD